MYAGIWRSSAELLTVAAFIQLLKAIFSYLQASTPHAPAAIDADRVRLHEHRTAVDVQKLFSKPPSMYVG